MRSRRSRLVAGVRPVHLRVVYRIAVLCDLKRVVVDDADDENRPDTPRVELWERPLDDADTVQFVTVAAAWM